VGCRMISFVGLGISRNPTHSRKNVGLRYR